MRRREPFLELTNLFEMASPLLFHLTSEDRHNSVGARWLALLQAPAVRRGGGLLLGAEVFYSFAKIRLLVKEIEADRASPGDGPEVDLAAALDQLAQPLVGPRQRVGVAGACRETQGLYLALDGSGSGGRVALAASSHGAVRAALAPAWGHFRPFCGGRRLKVTSTGSAP